MHAKCNKTTRATNWWKSVQHPNEADSTTNLCLCRKYCFDELDCFETYFNLWLWEGCLVLQSILVILCYHIKLSNARPTWWRCCAWCLIIWCMLCLASFLLLCVECERRETICCWLLTERVMELVHLPSNQTINLSSAEPLKESCSEIDDSLTLWEETATICYCYCVLLDAMSKWTRLHTNILFCSRDGSTELDHSFHQLGYSDIVSFKLLRNYWGILVVTGDWCLLCFGTVTGFLQ